MIGRDDEQALIGRLLEEVRSGGSGCLVLCGEPGVGKTVLLAHAVEQASDMRLLRAAGVETEGDLAFAGLDQLVRPALSLAERLPARQRDALLGALGLIDHPSSDRFLAGAATLSLLSEAAESGPVLIVVEDAHWLDQPSIEVVAFAARRLEAEGIALLVATRDEPWPGLPHIQIGGFGPREADELLRALTGPVAPDVRDRLVEETGGNPLALVELAKTLSPEQLAGAEPLPRALPLTDRVQEAFLARARLLPEATQTLLLVASADDTADPAVIFRAAAQLGVAPDSLEAAERAGLVGVDGGGRVEFGHPLVRAAVYRGATFASRVAAHRALAAVLEGEDHSGRRAWHLAATATGPDEDIAAQLERSAETARRRSGYAAAATGFERAAELSTTRAARAHRLMAAAQAAFQAGQADRAGGLADRADQMAADWSTAEVAMLRGRIEFARGSAVTAHTLLLEAARGMAQRRPRDAAGVLVEAARAAWNAYAPQRYAEVTALLETLTLPDRDPLGPVVATAIAIGDFVAGPPAEPVARMRRAIDAWVPFVTADKATGHDQAFVEASLALTGFTRVTADDAAGLALEGLPCPSVGLEDWLGGCRGRSPTCR